MQVRQGDVFIRPVPDPWGYGNGSGIPSSAKPRAGAVLVEGEKTGHMHEVTKGDVELFEKNGTLYMRVTSESATVTHPDHKSVTVPKGDYEVRRQKEYQGDAQPRQLSD